MNPDEARRREEQADREALERLYGPQHNQRKKLAKNQWGLGIAMLIIGPLVVLLGAALDGHPGIIGAGVVCLLVGLWSFIEGMIRASRKDRGN
jgi:hypothetical protein